ncbi:MAG: arsenate reductase ArsC [Acidimicrobiales bacterium]|nr:arsenate reductase ArsC [Acidimicrobiales bacterium]
MPNDDTLLSSPGGSSPQATELQKDAASATGHDRPPMAAPLRPAAERLTREFDGIFDSGTIEQFLDASYQQIAGNTEADDWNLELAERFARQRLQALAKTHGQTDDGRPTVLFLCVHNAGRSQMALGWFDHLANGRAVAWSGGSAPGTEINPVAVQAMAEVGIDISREYPKPWTDEIIRAVDVVVTMGCGDTCPVFPGKRYEDWQLDDPAGQDLDTVRRIRDEIGQRVRYLLNSLGVSTN